MINVTAKFKEEVQSGSRYFVCYAAIALKDGTVLELDNSKIWDGGFKFEEATSSSGSFDIGAVVIGKCTLLINNMTDEYSQYDFTGANVNLRIGLQFVDGTQEVFQKGVYTVDEADYNGAIISLSCLDNVSKFEKPYSDVQTTYPATLGEIVRDICFERGVILDTPEFSNHEYVVESRPDGEELTDLAVLSYVAQIAGCWGKCSPAGGFGLYWYNEISSVDPEEKETIDGGTFENEPTEAYDGGEFGSEPNETVDGGNFASRSVAVASAEDEAHRIYSISSMKVCTDDVVITGITVEGEEQSATFGTEGYILKISKNPFILPGQEQTVADLLGAKIVGMVFRPLTVSALSDPSIEAGDSAYIIDAKGNSYATYLTSVSFSTGSYENFVCDAKTPSRNSATQYKASTENVVAMRKEAEKVVSKYDQYVEQMTNLISQGSGMYKTDVTQEDGTIITYIHDKPVMEESSYIGYWTSNGIMASKDGGTTFAIDANGNALLNTLMLKGLSADWIKVGTLEGVKAILESGMVGGWNIEEDFLYSDVDTDNGKYRVYIQRHGNVDPENTWIYSVQKYNEETGAFGGTMYIRGDGYIYTPGFIKETKFLEIARFDKHAVVTGITYANGGLTVPTDMWYKGSYVADFVTEQGSNGIWTYEKWHSGKAVCWCKYNFGTATVDVPWGNIYESRSAYSLNYPTGLFIEEPIHQSITFYSSDGSAAWITTGITPPTKDSTGSFWLNRATAATLSNPTVAIYAVGKWK